MDGADSTLKQDLLTLVADLGCLGEAFKECDDRATVLRMSAGKAEHAADMFRHIADGLEHGWYECG